MPVPDNQLPIVSTSQRKASVYPQAVQAPHYDAVQGVATCAPLTSGPYLALSGCLIFQKFCLLLWIAFL
jgi:hypothetical protein